MDKRILFCVFILVLSVLKLDSKQVYAQTTFTEAFEGTPLNPTAWNSPRWDIVHHVRDWEHLITATPPSFLADHGNGCTAPPEQHSTTTWESHVYLCNDHVMTTSPGHGYGLVYLTPNHMVDFSSGEAVIQFNMSTQDTNSRDWPTITISPFTQNNPVALFSGIAQGTDLNHGPYNGMEIGFDINSGSSSIPDLYINRNGVGFGETGNGTLSEGIIAGTNQAMSRQPFRLTLSRTHVRFERLASSTGSNVVYINKSIADLGWDKGVVQFGHHAYDPTKDNPIQTWHWDSISINPAIPFSMIKGDKRIVTTTSSQGELVTFSAPAPTNSYLRFAALGTPHISTNGGATWTTPTPQWEGDDHHPEHASGYFMSIPAGTQQIRVRMSLREGCCSDLHANSFAIWSTTSGPTTPTNTPSPTQIETATPTLQTSSPTTAPKKLGDVDGDTHVTIADFNEVVGLFGTSQTNPFLDADLDKSGRVWIEDFNEVVANFGT